MPKNNHLQGEKGKIKEFSGNFSGGTSGFFFWGTFFFCINLVLGIITAVRVNSFLDVKITTLGRLSFWQVVLFLISAFIFIIFISFFCKNSKRKGIILKAMFIVPVYWGGTFFLSLWIGDTVALVVMAVLIFWLLLKPLIIFHDVCLLLATVGIGVIFGLRLDYKAAIALLVLLSVYDLVAVFVTKHMIKMVREMMEHGAVSAFILPRKIVDFGASLREAKPGGKFPILGGGDVVFPLIFCVSLVSRSLADSVAVAVFSLIGFLVSFRIFAKQFSVPQKKERRAIPALPPIALFSIIGFLITLI